jgi:hypothetical protein
MRSSTSACPGERAPAFRFDVERRDDFDFDLDIGLFPQIALLLAGQR